MNTILYRIPNKYFPGVKIKAPFHAKVNYEVRGDKVFIHDVAFSELCLEHIAPAGLIKEMKETLQKVECTSNIHPTIMSAIAPHI